MAIPAYFFVPSGDPCLYDTREKDWSSKPRRQNYSWSHQNIKTVSDLKATLRAGAFAWPGGYPLYFITSDGAALSFATVRKEFRRIAESIRENCSDGWRVDGCAVNYEDRELFDDHTNEKIECAYGDLIYVDLLRSDDSPGRSQ